NLSVRNSAGLSANASVQVTIIPADSSFNFSIVPRGGVSLVTSGSSASTVVGYAAIQPNSVRPTPSGLAIFGLRQNGVLVTEGSVPAVSSTQSGRIYAEVNGPVDTGIAIANFNTQDAVITFSFTDALGQDFGSGSTTIPAGHQIARFLDEPPFNAGRPVQGT